VVSYKQDLSKDPVLLDKVRQYTSSTLGLNYTSPFKAANDETAAAPVAKAN
jgi:malate dehydrogenase (quinone)